MTQNNKNNLIVMQSYHLIKIYQTNSLETYLFIYLFWVGELRSWDLGIEKYQWRQKGKAKESAKRGKARINPKKEES